MWNRYLRWQPGNRLTSCKFRNCLLLIGLAVVSLGWKPVDRLAFVVGERPVTLSEVRAWYYLHEGQCLPARLNAKSKQLLNRMIETEKLYGVASGYGTFKVDAAWLELAFHVIDNLHHYTFLDNAALIRCGISRELLEVVLKRDLTVQRFIQTRGGSLTSHENEPHDRLLDIAGKSASDVTVINLLF